jgi:hypothetical protein
MHGDERLKFAQLLGRLGVVLTLVNIFHWLDAMRGSLIELTALNVSQLLFFICEPTQSVA